jgi:NADPH2:quinone reductase
VRAVRPVTPGFPNEIEVVDLPAPEPGADEALVRVAASGLNRADLLQMRGGYPPPPGESAIPGLECAGSIEKLGKGVVAFGLGERVMALLAGGGQAELVVVPEGQLMRWPRALSAAEAAGLPEAAITAWTNLVVEGGLVAGEKVLVTGATSGVGSFAVQLASELGAEVFAAGRSADRLRALSSFGVTEHVLLDDGFVDNVHARTGGRGVDLVLDLVGGEWTAHALAALAPHGRLVLVGLTAGSSAKIDLAAVLRRRLRLIGSVLRTRPREEKSNLVRAFFDFAESKLASGALKPIVHRTFPFAEAADAYAALAKGGFTGKVVLTMA